MNIVWLYYKLIIIERSVFTVKKCKNVHNSSTQKEMTY